MSTEHNSQKRVSDRITDTPDTPIRVAVATKGNGLVNEHFGHAQEFQIYEVDPSQAVFVETRQVTPYCQQGHGEEDSLQRIIRTIEDCKAVLVMRIGVGPDDRLREAGIEPVQVYDVIETAVFDFYQQWSEQVKRQKLKDKMTSPT